MAKFIRYALATVFFAASVGCLTLCGWSVANRGELISTRVYVAQTSFRAQLYEGGVSGPWPSRERVNFFGKDWYIGRQNLGNEPPEWYGATTKSGRLFELTDRHFHFPLWYPALVFALAGVAVLRFRRQFSVRSALVAVSVVAALLGMVVAL